MHKKRIRFIAKGIALLFLISPMQCQTPGTQPNNNPRPYSDSTITIEVYTKIISQHQLKGLSIDVNTFDGNVTLSGFVDTPAQKKKAEALARTVDGVQNVNNLLKLKQLTRTDIIRDLFK